MRKDTWTSDGFFLVQKNNATRGCGKALFNGGVGKKKRRLGVREHEGKTIFGKLRIKGKISAAGFKDRKERNDRIEAAIKADAHETPGRGTLASEEMGEAVGPGIQLAVRELMGPNNSAGASGVRWAWSFKELVRALRDTVESMGARCGVWSLKNPQDASLERAILEPGRTGLGAFGEV